MLLIAENKAFSQVQILTHEEVGRQQEIEASPQVLLLRFCTTLRITILFIVKVAPT
jgi:hypothetical protein